MALLVTEQGRARYAAHESGLASTHGHAITVYHLTAWFLCQGRSP